MVTFVDALLVNTKGINPEQPTLVFSLHSSKDILSISCNEQLLGVLAALALTDYATLIYPLSPDVRSRRVSWWIVQVLEVEYQYVDFLSQCEPHSEADSDLQFQ